MHPNGKMNNITVISLRVLSIYLVVSGVEALGGISLAFSMEASDSEIPFVALQYLSVVLPIIVGIVIWFLSKRIGNLVSRDLDSSGDLLTEESFVRAGTFLIGLYLFTSRFVLMFAAYLRYYGLEYAMESNTVLWAFVLKFAEVVLGLLLMAGHRALAKLFIWLRYAGLKA